MRFIKAQHRGRALWITFDRPEKLNVLHAEDLSELRDVITGLAPGVQAIVLTGAGQVAFSAGMNIEAFVGLTPARAHALIGDLAQVMRAIRHSPVVTVAAVNGYCLGAAFELALACDLRVVTPTASLGCPRSKSACRRSSTRPCCQPSSGSARRVKWSSPAISTTLTSCRPPASPTWSPSRGSSPRRKGARQIRA